MEVIAHTETGVNVLLYTQVFNVSVKSFLLSLRHLLNVLFLVTMEVNVGMEVRAEDTPVNVEMAGEVLAVNRLIGVGDSVKMEDNVLGVEDNVDEEKDVLAGEVEGIVVRVRPRGLDQIAKYH